MNKIKKINKKNTIFSRFTVLTYIATLLLLTQLSCYGFDLITGDLFKSKNDEKNIIVIGEIDKAKQELKKLYERKEKLEKAEPEFTEKIDKRITEKTFEINKLNTQLREKPKNIELLKSKLGLLNETYQQIKDIQASRKQLVKINRDHIQLLENYIKDPSFKDYIKEYQQQKRPYTYDDFLILHEMIPSQEESIDSLQEQLKNSKIELDSRKQIMEVTKEILEKNKETLQNFIKDPEKTATPDYMFEFTNEEKLQLLTLEENVYKTKKELDEYRIKEVKHKLRFINTKIFIAKIKLNILKKTTNNIKSLIRISESDITEDKGMLEKKKIESFKIQEKYRAEIEKITQKYESEKKQLDEISNQLNIPIDTKFERWAFEPTVDNQFINILKIASANEAISLLYTKKLFGEAQMAKNEVELFQNRIDIETKETFYKTENRKFASEEAVNKEIKKYNAIKADIKAIVPGFKEKINYLQDKLKIKDKALENIKMLQSKSSNVFRTQPMMLRSCLNFLNTAQESIKQQIQLAQTTILNYENIIKIKEKSEKHVNLILSGLNQLVGKWFRPSYAIKFEKIPNIIPEFTIFITDLRNYITQFSLTNLFEKIKMAFPKNLNIISFFVKLLLLLLLLLLFRIYTPRIKNQLLALSSENKKTKFLALIISFFIEFTIKHFISISLWVITFAAIKIVNIPDRYIAIVFYLASIPYLIYIFNRLLRHFAKFDKEHNLLFFMSIDYKKRLHIVSTIIAYSTITIQLFRKSFELGIYFQSEFPLILSALNWIIGQVALIYLITKELIKRVIPKNWKWLQERADSFYYFILILAIIIIIMANPYIGLGKLLLYVIQRLLLTAILVVLLFAAHNVGKKVSLKLFFKTDDELIQARFTYGKTIYGLYVIFSFILLVLVGVLVASYIWDWGITFTSIWDLLNKRLFWTGPNSDIEVSTLSLIKIIAFVISGLIFSLLINKYVLKRIFDLLLVEPGVQYAITSILKYIIITTFLVIGFNNVGLGAVVTWLVAALALGIGWIIKEPLADLVYYFLILIQRPIKIGDYVKLPDGTQGVVRKISPRATLIKFRNSEQILVPNSRLLAGKITNWNYATRFVAFDDMYLVVPYQFDPSKVKELILQAMEHHPNILKSPRPIVRLENFGDNGYQFLIRGFVSAHYTLDMWDIASDVRFEIVKLLRENKIAVAVPIFSSGDGSLTEEAEESARERSQTDFSSNSDNDTRQND